MKQFSSVKENIKYVFIGALLMSSVFNVMGFSFTSDKILTVLKIIYFVLFALTWLAIYKSNNEKSNKRALVSIPFLLLLSGIPFKVITLGLLLPLLIIKKAAGHRNTLIIVLYLILIVLGCIGIMIDMLFGDFGKNTVINESYAPSREYRIVVIDSDQGALGGDTIVNLEKFYYGILKRDIKTLYSGEWGENPQIKWIDNQNVEVNGVKINIH
jgi:hypothetical protein